MILASSDDQVLALCREFVAECTPHELAQLASSCEPVPCTNVAEIQQYALALIRHAGIGERFGAPALHRVSTFFTRAALRLVELVALGRDEEAALAAAAGAKEG
jgi:hypothetical protein